MVEIISLSEEGITVKAKVRKQHYTYLITIPKVIAKKLSIKEGDTIIIEAHPEKKEIVIKKEENEGRS